MEFLSLHSLAPLFDSIVTMDDAPLKPSPEPIHLAMQQAGGARAIMFGDTKVISPFFSSAFTFFCFSTVQCPPFHPLRDARVIRFVDALVILFVAAGRYRVRHLCWPHWRWCEFCKRGSQAHACIS